MEKVREDRAVRDSIMKGIVVYTVNGRACISNRTSNRFLPTTMSAWLEEVAWDWRRRVMDNALEQLTGVQLF